MITQKHLKYTDKFLVPVYDNAKSYYKKVIVRDYLKGDYLKGDVVAYKKELFSYDTLVCTIENGRYTLNHNVPTKLLLSRTTTRHIKDFLLQNAPMLDKNIAIYGKKDILKYEG